MNQIPGDSEDLIDEGYFSIGRVVEVSGGSLTIREYDFSKDSDVEAVYRVPPTAEFGNIETLAGLNAGDDVILDYQMLDDIRIVTMLVKQERGTDDAAGHMPIDP